jgi:hypothetical protein
MAIDDRVILELKGSVPLDLFATAMSAFASLIKILTAEVAGNAQVEWVVEELEGGSARAAIVGQSNDPRAVQEVVHAYDRVGAALQQHEAIPFSEAVNREVLKIANIVDGKVSAVVLQGHTVTGEVEVVEQSVEPKSFTAFGAVEGMVQTLTSRNGLRFTLFDSLNDRAIYCYLDPGQHEMMRDMWDQRAVVQGLVTRERQTGRPTEVRHITRVEPVGPGDYKRARGVLAGQLKVDELPEVTLRRIRDAES